MATAFKFFALAGFVCGCLVKYSASVSSMKIYRNARPSGGLLIWTTHASAISQCAAICLQLTECKSFGFEGMLNQCYFYSNRADTNINPLMTVNGADYADASTIPGVSKFVVEFDSVHFLKYTILII